MAQDNGSGFLMLAAAGVAAYFGWQWWQTHQAAAATTGTSAGGSAPVVIPLPQVQTPPANPITSGVVTNQDQGILNYNPPSEVCPAGQTWVNPSNTPGGGSCWPNALPLPPGASPGGGNVPPIFACPPNAMCAQPLGVSGWF